MLESKTSHIGYCGSYLGFKGVRYTLGADNAPGGVLSGFIVIVQVLVKCK